MPDQTTNAAAPKLTYNGQFTHGLDEKRRLQIPSKWRPESGEMEWRALLWPKGTQQGYYIVALTVEAHERLMAKLTQASMADEKALSVMRYFSRNSGDLVMDRAGRVCLPEQLARTAGIEKEAVLVGMWDRFEIWSPERFGQMAAMEDAIVPMELSKYL